MKMITGLTKANIRNTGIELAPEHDFTDDGNKFRGFIYKGMPITQCRSDGECYLSIRVDYLDNQFTYKEWMETNEYHLTRKFNGVFQFDLDELIANLDTVIAKVNEMNEAAKAEVIDMTKVIAKADQEIKDLNTFIETVRTSLKWWTLSEYQLKNARECINKLMLTLERSRNIDFDSLDRHNKKTKVESLNKYGYVIIDLEHDYWVETLEKYMA